MSGSDIDLGGIDDNDNGGDKDKTNLIRDVIEFCGGPDLIQVFGPTGSGKTEFAMQVVESSINDANKSVLFIDTERNLSDNERLDGADYVYIPEWNDLYAYLSGKSSKLSDDPFGENSSKGNTLKEKGERSDV